MTRPLPEPREGQPIKYGGLPGAEALIAIPLAMVIAYVILIWRLLGK